ncbi:MAG: PD-(D/E)XK nuclease-like domain-containing protein [Sulfuritalea sp.]|nr:PD-(D/E)XK nuclease-like domain-containing protein [Sulfuritalea sp.]
MGKTVPFFFIAAEKAAPFAVAVYQASEEMIGVGRAKYRAGLQLLAWCRKQSLASLPAQRGDRGDQPATLGSQLRPGGLTCKDLRSRTSCRTWTTSVRRSCQVSSASREKLPQSRQPRPSSSR